MTMSNVRKSQRTKPDRYPDSSIRLPDIYLRRYLALATGLHMADVGNLLSHGSETTTARYLRA